MSNIPVGHHEVSVQGVIPHIKASDITIENVHLTLICGISP